MVTPRVVEEVRNHFGCPDLEGAELEDQVLELEHANDFFPSNGFFFSGWGWYCYDPLGKKIISR